jgi:hypothetical protein
MVEIHDFPDGRLEVRWKGHSLPYSAFEKLRRVNHAAIVDNKRLGEILAWIKQQQGSQPRFKRIPAGPRRSDHKAGPMKIRALSSGNDFPGNVCPTYSASASAVSPARWRDGEPREDRASDSLAWLRPARRAAECINRRPARRGPQAAGR